VVGRGRGGNRKLTGYAIQRFSDFQRKIIGRTTKRRYLNRNLLGDGKFVKGGQGGGEWAGPVVWGLQGPGSAKASICSVGIGKFKKVPVLRPSRAGAAFGAWWPGGHCKRAGERLGANCSGPGPPCSHPKGAFFDLREPRKRVEGRRTSGMGGKAEGVGKQHWDGGETDLIKGGYDSLPTTAASPKRGGKKRVDKWGLKKKKMGGISDYWA